MPRPPLVLGTWGSISRAKRGNVWVAYARFRDFDGVTRQVERQGGTGRKAEDALLVALRDRARVVGATMTSDARVKDLAETWFEEFSEADKAHNTLALYRRTLDNYILPVLGDVRLREASVPIVERVLVKMAQDRGYSSARLSQVVMKHMFGLAVRQGAMIANPVIDVKKVAVPVREVRAIELGEVALLRQRLREWDASKDGGGRDRVTDLADVVDMLLATGTRTGEVLAIRWRDIYLNAEPPRVDILGTVIHAAGNGLIVQDRTKTASSRRGLLLPVFAEEMLERRKREQFTSEFAFPSSVGTLRSPNNFRRQWRDFRAAYRYPDWVTPKTFRKTVATLIRDNVDLQTASSQLGHSGTKVTQEHYTVRIHDAPDVTAVLQQFAS